MSIISGDIEKAAAILCAEDVVAIPTETVYGLAGNIFSEKAINRIFQVKQRPLFNPLIVHLHSQEQLKDIAINIPKRALLLAEKFWPGSLTLVLDKHESIPDLITAGKNTVACRVPNHPVTRELMRSIPFPLAAPSANPFNRISPTTAEHVEGYFGNEIQMVLDGGPCEKGLESTIVGFPEGEPVLYRLGAIPREDLEKVIGKLAVQNTTTASPQAPGMLKKHYSPTTPSVLVDDLKEINSLVKDKKAALLTLSPTSLNVSLVKSIYLSENADLLEAASKLYSALHELDSLKLDMIIIQRMPEHGLGRSMNDRLRRAVK